MSNVEVCVPISLNSADYYVYLVENYRKFSSEKHEIKFYPYAMTSIEKFDSEINSIGGTGLFQGRLGEGSSGHAGVLNSLLSRGSKEDTVRILADSDTVMLTYGWDDIIVDMILRKKVFDVIGATYESIGGFSSGNSKEQTYKGKPNAVWFAYDPNRDFSDLDMSPEKGSFVEISDVDSSVLYGLPIGSRLLKDVGWRIPSYLRDRKLSSFGLTHAKPSGAAKAIKTGEDYHEEFQLAGLPFLAHQRGSMKHKFRVDPLSRSFYDAVDAWTEKTLQ